MSNGNGPVSGANRNNGTNEGLGMAGGNLGSVASSREADLSKIGVSSEMVEKYRIVFIDTASDASGYFHAFMGDKKVRLATAGYSASPSGYEGPTTAFMAELVTALGDDVGLVTSPTCDKGSIDAITSTVGQRAKAPLGYVTADSYLSYVNPDNFPADIDREEFAKQLKFSLPTAEVYSEATASLSNCFLVTGGRNASVSDFMHAIRRGNRVIVLLNEDVASPAWDPAKKRVDNAAEYLFRMAGGATGEIPMDHEFNQKVVEFFRENQSAIKQLVRFINANAEGAVQEAVAHLTA